PDRVLGCRVRTGATIIGIGRGRDDVITICKDLSIVATERDGLITVSPRNTTVLVMAGLAACAVLAFFLLSRLHLSADGALEQSLVWVAMILLPGGGLLAFLGLIGAMTRKCRFDCNRALLTWRRTTFRFADLGQIQLRRIPF